MIPRPTASQRGIFHLGEEGGDDGDHRGADHGKDVFVGGSGTHHHLGERRPERDHGRPRRRERGAADAAGVGLQILVQQHRHHARGTSHIVLKQMVLPTASPPARRRRGPCGGGGFLRACWLCRRELSPDKDVYMYRGDQGFCSEECRRQQMLRDEAREREATIRRERMRRGLPHHHHHGPRSAPAPAPAIRGAPRRLAAVAY